MEITIKNCNNIDLGKINIQENKLNIKFGINGTGKSTVAKAIQFKIQNEEGLNHLLPFKLRKKNTDDLRSEVVIDGKINSVSIFNEEYVKQFLFKPDELVNNSFEIFIKTPKYLKTEGEIEKQLEDIKKIFVDNAELDEIILDFENLSKSFKTTKDGLSDASAISKGLKDGNKIDNIPENLMEYSPFIQNKEKCVSWLEWQRQGNDFSDGHENCPYCVSPTDEAKKEKIKSVSNQYDKSIIKNFIEIIRVLENLGDYFSSEAKTELERITQKIDGLRDEEKNYLVTIKGQVDTFLQRLKNLREISFHNLKDEKIKGKIDGFVIKIDELFDKLNSNKTKQIVNSFNKSLAKTSKEIIKLQTNIGAQKKEIQNAIYENQKNVNQFLKNAGYRYQVLIEDEDGQHKIKLRHIDFGKNISGGDQHLSFGERNAFALVLFMYEVLSKNPGNSDLIILDDPISSFDRNKKYAILQMLFREKKSFKGKTVLMLTHDFEPLIDALKAVDRKFQDQVSASFISSKKSVLEEKNIEKDDILTFPQIFESICNNNDVNDFSKLVYMRRNSEILNDKGNKYQILSDLFHKRTKDQAKQYRRENINEHLSDKGFDEEFKDGESKVKEKVPDFEYIKMLDIVNDRFQLKHFYDQSKNGYEKMQIFRIINGEFTRSDNFSDVFKKFINETYHIENDFIHQLNPQKYDLIPEFIIEECDQYVSSIT